VAAFSRVLPLARETRRDRRKKAGKKVVEVLRRLDHPNVIKMYAVFQTSSQYHIVLDLWVPLFLFLL